MKKLWSSPEVNELSVRDTAYGYENWEDDSMYSGISGTTGNGKGECGACS